MAGVVGTQAEDGKPDENCCCDVSQKDFAVANTRCPELFGNWLRTENSMTFVAVVV